MSVVTRGYGGSGTIISRGYCGWLREAIEVVCIFVKKFINRTFRYDS